MSPPRVDRRTFAAAAFALPATLAAAQAGPVRSPIAAVRFTPDGSSVLSLSRAGLEERSWPDLAVRRSWPAPFAQPAGLAFSPAGDRLALVGGDPAERGQLRLVAWPSGELVRELDLGADVATDVSFSPDGAHLAAPRLDRAVHLSNADLGDARTLAGHGRGVLAAAWLDARTLVTAGLDGPLRVWSATAWNLVRSLEQSTRPILGLATRPGTRPGPAWLASIGDDRAVRFWQPSIGRLVRFTRPPAVANALAWTPDGARLLTAGRDGLVRVVSPDDASILRELPLAPGVWLTALAVHPHDHSFLAGAEDGRLLPGSLSP